MLAPAIVLPPQDDSNSLLPGLVSLLPWPPSVFSCTVARLILLKYTSDHVSTLLSTLQWLPITLKMKCNVPLSLQGSSCLAHSWSADFISYHPNPLSLSSAPSMLPSWLFTSCPFSLECSCFGSSHGLSLISFRSLFKCANQSGLPCLPYEGYFPSLALLYCLILPYFFNSTYSLLT